MTATEILQGEHRVIEQVLNCLEKIAEQAEAEQHLDEGAARQALDFLQVFADRCHHAKEEHCLFPLMEARGLPRQGGPTGVMRFEHEEGRRHVAAMLAAILGAAAGEEAPLRQFSRHARAYVEHLRQHIHKEDHCLFPMANQVFSGADQANLLERFEHVEHHDVQEGAHEKYLDLARSLAERLHVPKAAATACGCGHGKH